MDHSIVLYLVSFFCVFFLKTTYIHTHYVYSTMLHPVGSICRTPDAKQTDHGIMYPFVYIDRP